MPIDEQHEARKEVRTKSVKQRAAATKRFLDISEIRDGVVVMKDGTLRRVLMVSSINFFLKGVDEQDAIIAAYVQFLNALESPVQFVIQSRKLNVDPYLQMLVEKEKEHTTDLMKSQTAEYRDFITQLIDLQDIMERRYFVVVPYNPLTNKQKGFFKRFSELWAPGATIKLKEKEFQKRKYDLDLLTQRISSGLYQMGLEITQLDTQSLIELYYDTYNPDVAATEHLEDINKIQIDG